MNEKMILDAGRELSVLLNGQLDNFEAQTITLTREQALITLAFVDGAIGELEKQSK